MRADNTHVYPQTWSCVKKNIETIICLQLFTRIKLRYVDLCICRYCFFRVCLL